MMRNNRNRTIQWGGRSWRHQQAQGLMRSLGESGEVRATCMWGQWFTDAHVGGRSAMGHGMTLWSALCECVERLTGPGGLDDMSVEVTAEAEEV